MIPTTHLYGMSPSARAISGTDKDDIGTEAAAGVAAYAQLFQPPSSKVAANEVDGHDFNDTTSRLSRKIFAREMGGEHWIANSANDRLQASTRAEQAELAEAKNADLAARAQRDLREAFKMFFELEMTDEKVLRALRQLLRRHEEIRQEMLKPVMEPMIEPVTATDAGLNSRDSRSSAPVGTSTP